jgi:hypothetical protein
MQTRTRWVCPLLIFALYLSSASTVLAQSPTDITFTLAAKNNRSIFRIGEPIDVELRFASSTPGRYEVYEYRPRTTTRFLPDRADGNRPGEHKESIRLRSNSLEIEVILPEVAWSADQLRAGAAAIDEWQPGGPCRSQISSDGKVYPPCNPQPRIAAINAARALSLLDTREAALTIVRLYRRHLPAEIRTWLEDGLRRSPYRPDVIAAMERDFEAPNVGITRYWIGTLIDLAVTSRSPEASYNHYYDRLAAISERKIGQARDVSLATLATRPMMLERHC